MNYYTFNVHQWKAHLLVFHLLQTTINRMFLDTKLFKNNILTEFNEPFISETIGSV